MKKLVIILVLLAVISPVFAQTQRQNTGRNVETDMYYINVPVEKIIPSHDGYIIMYRKMSNQIGTVGIPNEWFYDSAGRAQMVRLPRGPNWPTMSVFYKGGEFSHVRLYIHNVKGHRTWGAIAQGVDVSRFFTDRENFNIEF